MTFEFDNDDDDDGGCDRYNIRAARGEMVITPAMVRHCALSLRCISFSLSRLGIGRVRGGK